MKRLAGAVVVLVGLAFVPGAAAAGGWVVVPSANSLGPEGGLASISCVRKTWCMAIGDRIDASGAQVASAQRWDGTAWRVVPTPASAAAGAHTTMTSIACPAPTMCVAVGDTYRAVGASVTFMLRWNGVRWSRAKAPAAGGSLSAVACASAWRCVAVGQTVDASDEVVPLAERWNGRTWRITRTPTLGGEGDLLGVACPAATVCIAVGESRGSPLLERWDGVRWTLMPAASPRTGALEAVSCTSASACIAVGQTLGENPRTLAARLNGGVWSVSPTPNPPRSPENSLNTVACWSASGCVAIGSSSDENGTTTFIERWNGRAWRIAVFPHPARWALAGVACVDPSPACIAAGARSNPASGRPAVPLALTWDGASWTRQQTQAPLGAVASALGDVACASVSTCEAVGWTTATPTVQTPFAERLQNGRWQVDPAAATRRGTYDQLASVSCPTAVTCVAAGFRTPSSGLEQQLVERRAGSGWQIQPTQRPVGELTGELTSVSCATASDCVAVGDYDRSNARGLVLAELWDGTAWQLTPLRRPSGAIEFGLGAVSCSAPTFCIAVGGQTRQDGRGAVLIERWDGTRWHGQHAPTPPGASLARVSCAAQTACMAVGSTHTGTFAERYDGTRWTVTTPQTIATDTFDRLDRVACTTGDACTAVGVRLINSSAFETLAERWNGKHWSIQTTPNPSPPETGGLNIFSGVACPTTSTCIAAGTEETLASVTVTLIARWSG